MKKTLVCITIVLAIFVAFYSTAWATNGDNLIGIGPISRAMGGVGVAAPQDAISAIFANPAAMCFGPYCPGSEATFAGTYFDPKVKSTINLSRMGMGEASEKSQTNAFVSPAIGITAPITDKLRFGIGAYGVSGMGVDYRDTDPIYQNLYSQFQVMKFAPNIAYLITPDLSVGASVSLDYASLDLGSGGSPSYALGLQLGALYHLGMFNFGLSYITPQKTKHERVFDFDGDGTLDTLELESPNTVMFGVSMTPSAPGLLSSIPNGTTGQALRVMKILTGKISGCLPWVCSIVPYRSLRCAPDSTTARTRLMNIMASIPWAARMCRG